MNYIIGLVELERYDNDTLQRREAIFNKYSELFSSFTWAELPEYKNDKKESSYHLYPLRIKGVSEQQRDLIIKEIFEQDVSVNVHFSPVPMMSFYNKMGYDIKNYPVTFDNYSREISLPVYYDLTNEQVQIVVNAVQKAVESMEDNPFLNAGKGSVLNEDGIAVIKFECINN